MKYHNKLVRDRIPEIIAKNGATAHIRRIETDDEYVRELFKKLTEESTELKQTPTIEELADVKEVFDALVAALGYVAEDVEVARQQKAVSNGQFNDRIFLISTEG